MGKGVIERDVEQKVPDLNAENGALLRRRVPLGPRRRQPAENGYTTSSRWTAEFGLARKKGIRSPRSDGSRARRQIGFPCRPRSLKKRPVRAERLFVCDKESFGCVRLGLSSPPITSGVV